MTRTANVLRSFAFVSLLPLVACGGQQVPPASQASASVPAAPASAGGLGANGGATPYDATVGVRAEGTPQKIERDALLGVEVANESKIAPVLARAHAAASQFGGYISLETSSSIAFKVPTEKLDAAVDRVTSGGDLHVTQREVTARDVTSQYVDLSIRIDNARRMQARLKELAGQTEDVARLLEIEKELSRVTTDLETLEGQMRLMQNETTYATVTMNVTTEVKPGPVGWVFYGLYSGVKWLFVWS